MDQVIFPCGNRDEQQDRGEEYKNARDLKHHQTPSWVASSGELRLAPPHEGPALV
jgi:hypothetical protein